MQRPKKPRLVAFAQTLGLAIPLRVIGGIVRELRSGSREDDYDIPLSNIAREITRYVSGIDTQFGHVVKYIQLPLKSGGYLAWPICCPFALLDFLCERRFEFGTFLHAHIGGREANIVVWSDETTSGNQLRADMKRTFLSFYWSFCDLPDYFKNSNHSWWPVGILSHDSVKTIAGETSGIMRHILRFFFMGRHNFDVGVRLKMGGRGS